MTNIFRIGTIVDIEEDTYEISSWETLINGEAAILPWVVFKSNVPDGEVPTFLDFSFDPPLSAQGTNFTLSVVLQDFNEKEPQSEKYDIEV